MGNAGSGEEVQNDEGGMEVKKAVRKLTSRKAGGVCGIHVEMVKVGGCTVVQKHLTEILQVPGPQEWRKVIIVPTYLHEGL